MSSLPQVLRARLGAAALGLWFAAMLIVGAGLLAKHLVALPGPTDNAKLAAINVLRSPHSQAGWLAVHVLYSECRCSQRIVDHLLTSHRPDGWSEMILWVGDAAPSAELETRFEVKRVDRRDLARYGIEGAPLLVALDPAGVVRYAGGYTERKQGPVIDDLRILDTARRRESLASLPIFGCAVSDRLRRELAALPTL